MHKIISALFLGAALTCATVAQAAEISIATGPDYQPFTDQARNDGGTVTRLVRVVFERMGYRVTVEWTPWVRGIALTADSRSAATFPYMRTEQCERSFLYSDPIVVMRSILLHCAGEAFDPANIESFSGRHFCLPMGYASVLAERLKPLADSGRLTFVRPITQESCAEMIVQQHADAMEAIETRVDTLLTTGGPRLVRSNFMGGDISLHLLMPRILTASADLLEKFNQILPVEKANARF
jgi:polar amino acid transport system substrate-binding protein